MSQSQDSSTSAPGASTSNAKDRLASEHDAADLAKATSRCAQEADGWMFAAKLGYKQELRRNFSMIEVFGIAFSIMGLLPSIASTLTFSIPAGPVGMVWGWFVASGFIFIVGLAMADLGSSMPTSGGLYWWTHFFASPQWRNPLSFLVGYSNTIGLVGGICSIDYGFALMLLSVVIVARDGEWEPSNGVIYGTFAACVICHGILASVMARIMGRLQTFFVVSNFILILITIIALPIGKKNKNDGAYVFGHLENLTTWPTGWAFMLSWLTPIWTIGAFDSCVHLAEEAANATKAVPYGILMSIGSCWIFGFIINIVLAVCINPDLASVAPGRFGQPMAQIYYDALGKNATIGLMTLVFIVQFTMGLSIVVAASRQSWAFSRDGALPFSSFFRPISKTFGFIPLRTIWGCVGLALVLGLLTLIAPAAASALFSLAIAGNNVAWGTPIFCRVMWGQAKFKPGPFYTGKRLSTPIAWIAVVYLVFATILTMFPSTGPDPPLDEMNYAVVINGAVWVGALLYYYIDARKWFKGPKITLNLDDLSESQEKALATEDLKVEGLSPVRSRSLGGAAPNKPEV
ncbi:MAG: GABA-specific high-affinity permease [Sclerophora amabilis]|nr:MAG: GABA-specific high-affinity permease [Sclerophora amabilis]